MATRDLPTNKARIEKELQRIENVAERELIRAYNRAMDDVRTTIARLYERFRTEGELTRAEASRFLRVSNIEAEIREVVRPYLLRNEELLKEASAVSFQESFYRNAWAVDVGVGATQQWGVLNDNMVRAAIGLTDEGAALAGIMDAGEVERHVRVLQDAFKNYSDDTRKWIGRAVTDGVIKGESVDRLARRIRREGIAKSFNSAQTIARTETLRSTGLGAQTTYAQARDKGVSVIEIWDATLDSRTRPDHAQLDGMEKDRQAGGWSTPYGIVPGPRRSGVAEFDINCRCTIRPQVGDLSPSVRRIRDEGIQPYQTFSEWARRQGIAQNRYGQRFRFLEE